jgi:hypothetical protein
MQAVPFSRVPGPAGSTFKGDYVPGGNYDKRDVVRVSTGLKWIAKVQTDVPPPLVSTPSETAHWLLYGDDSAATADREAAQSAATTAVGARNTIVELKVDIDEKAEQVDGDATAVETARGQVAANAATTLQARDAASGSAVQAAGSALAAAQTVAPVYAAAELLMEGEGALATEIIETQGQVADVKVITDRVLPDRTGHLLAFGNDETGEVFAAFRNDKNATLDNPDINIMRSKSAEILLDSTALHFAFGNTATGDVLFGMKADNTLVGPSIEEVTEKTARILFDRTGMFLAFGNDETGDVLGGFDADGYATFRNAGLERRFDAIEASIGGTPASEFRRDVIWDGDSRQDANSDVPGVDLSTDYRTNMYGFLYWAQMFSGGRFLFRNDYNLGVGGDTTAAQVARLPALVAHPAKTVVLLIGTNDLAGSTTAAAVIARYVTIRDTLLAAGKRIIWIAEFPRGDATANGLTFTLTQEKFEILMQMRAWIVAQSDNPRIYVVDVWPEAADPLQPFGQARPGVLKDGLHESGLGALIGGRLIADYVNEIYAPTPVLPVSNADRFSATNPTGNLVPNGFVTGAGGSITGGAGQLADGWTATGAAGVTAVYAKHTDAAGGVWQQVTLSGAPTTSDRTLHILTTLTASDIAAGNTLEAVMEIDVPAGMTGVRQAASELRLTYPTLAAVGSVAGNGDRDDTLMPSQAFGGVSLSPPLPVGAEAPTSATYGVAIIVHPTIPVNAVFRFRKASVRKI